MISIGISGHFGEGKTLLNGQTIKTKIVTKELEKNFGRENVVRVDSHGGLKMLPGFCLKSFQMFRQCKHIIITPGQKGLRIVTPLYSFFNLFLHRKLYYVVIGGWIDWYVKKHRIVGKLLHQFDGIYVETTAMKIALEELGYKKVEIIPNFKDVKLVKSEEFIYHKSSPYKVCTFSRVMKEKGIEAAIEAVKQVNRNRGKEIYDLTIFGQIEPSYKERFIELERDFPEYIRYGGLVPFDQSTEVLRDYFALLFPTYYAGEGFAGTLIDAMSAGVPAVASDWRYNKEIVKDGVNGKLLKACDLARMEEELTEELMNQLQFMADHPEDWNSMKVSSLREVEKYQPEKAMRVLIDKIRELE